MSRNKIILNRTSLVLLAAIFIILLIQLNNIKVNDFSSYILSSEALLKNYNPYNTGNPFQYIYPLTLTFILIPFTLIPDIIAQNIWFIFNLFFLLTIINTLFDQLKIDRPSPLYIFLLLLTIVLLDIIQNNFRNGQINIFILFLCILFLNYYTRKKNLVSALILALAISIKLVPVILLGFCIVKKDFKIVFLTIGFAFFFIIIPFVVVGANLFSYYDYYINIIMRGVLTTQSNGSENNGMFFSPAGLVNFLFPKINLGIWLYIMNGIIVLAVVFFIQSLIARKVVNQNVELVYYIYLLSILLISPMSETHHLIFLLPIIQIILVDLWKNFRQKKIQDWVLYLLILAPLFLAKPVHFSLYFILIIASLVGYIKYILLNSFSSNEVAMKKSVMV